MTSSLLALAGRRPEAAKEGAREGWQQQSKCDVSRQFIKALSSILVWTLLNGVKVVNERLWLKREACLEALTRASLQAKGMQEGLTDEAPFESRTNRILHIFMSKYVRK